MPPEAVTWFGDKDLSPEEGLPVLGNDITFLSWENEVFRGSSQGTTLMDGGLYGEDGILATPLYFSVSLPRPCSSGRWRGAAFMPILGDFCWEGAGLQAGQNFDLIPQS